jgi:hypothetical protein
MEGRGMIGRGWKRRKGRGGNEKEGREGRER